MQPRALGPSDLSICPLIIGTMARRGDHRETRLELYRSALEHGLTTFDTAPLYGFGRAEQLLGECIGEVPRDSVQILGKVGLRWDAGDHGDVLFETDDGHGGRRQVRRNSRPESVVAEVANSLERLQTGYLDLVQIHQPDPHTSIEETMGALLDLRRDGRVRHIGVSNFSLAQIRSAQRTLGDVPLCSLQADYSLLQRLLEETVLPYCRHHGIGVLAYSPLAAGWLARRDGLEGAQGRLRQALQQVLHPMASRYGVSPAAIALAWAMRQPGISGVISGISSQDQLLEQIPAAYLDVSDEDLQRLARAFQGILRPDVHTARGGLLRRSVRGARRRAGRLLRRLGLDPSAFRQHGGG